MQRIFLLFISFLTEAITVWQYCSSLFFPVHSNLVRSSVLSVLYITLFLLSVPGNMGINIVAFFIVNIVFLTSQFHLKIMSAFFHSAMLTAIMEFSELVLLGIILRFSPDFPSDAGIELILYTVFSKLLFFTIICLLAHCINSKSENGRPYDRSIYLLMTVPVFSMFIMFTFFTIDKGILNTLPFDIMVTISAILLLIMNLLIFWLNQYNQKKNVAFTDMQLRLQKESDSTMYYEMLLSQSENQSILIHDIKKHLQSIDLLNQKHETEKIRAYIHQLMDSSDLKESVRICDNEMLNAILNRYQQQCHEKRIAFLADIRTGTLKDILPNDLTALFCNLLDNAVESAETMPDSFLEIMVQKKEKTPFVVIIVINSCPTNPLPAPSSFPLSHKSEKRSHGFGIKSIQKVVQKYHGDLRMYYDTKASAFHTIITLKQL